ncbi:MAG: NAD(P)/FAD-dependent oxidoreductase [Oceanicaulis sp.]
MTAERLDVLIIGAGFAGIAACHALLEEGLRDFAIVDRAGGPGGVWRANTYPGAACDVPSHLYSFSFFLNPDWSRKYSPQPEIAAYLARAVTELGLGPHMRYGRTVTRLEFDEGAGRWCVTFTDGAVIEARTVISAVGQLAEPVIPELEGAERFRGPKVHTAHWDRSVDYAGKRVAVIGSAASAVQVVPKLAETAAELTVFQRTPNWVIDKPDRAFTGFEKALFRRAPWLHRLYRLGSYLVHEARYPSFLANNPAGAYTRWSLKRRLKREVADPALRDQLTPDYAPGCKRILLSDEWFSTLQREHVRLVPERAAALTEDAVITGSGEAITADAIVFATGFSATEFLASLDVVNGEGLSLREHWAGAPKAYRGVAVSGFPNLFMLYGPNTNLGHNSIVFMLERQAEYAARQAARIVFEDLRTLDVTPEAEAEYDARLQKRLAGTVWAGACPSWYKTEDGRIVNNWPGLAARFAMTLGSDDAWAWTAQR